MSLRERTIKGLTWSGTSQVITQISQFSITAILARLLSPNDFGLLGMTVVFTNFINIFCEMGVSGALIQRQDLDERHYSSVFWLNIMAGIVLTFITIAISPYIAKFYSEPKLKPILMLISINFFITSFTIVQKTILSKDMDFKKIAVIDIVAVIISGVVGIYFAYLGYGVWSLIYRLLALTSISMILLWALSTWKPKFIFSMDAIKDIFSFSANLMGFNVINYIARNIDNLLIGKFLGSEPLGYYTLAYRLMLYPIQNISGVIGKVMFPAFSRIQNDLEKVRTTYLKMIKAISLVTFPLMFGLFAVAPEFVNVLFGEKWQPTVMLIRILCICGIFQSVGTTVGNIILSQGRAGLQFQMQLVGTILVTIFIVVGLKWDIIGVSISYVVYTTFFVHLSFYITNKLIKLSYVKFYYKMLPSYAMGAVTAVSLMLTRQFFALTTLPTLITLICTGLLIYISLLIVSKNIIIKDRRFFVTLFKP
ncbi:Teichuronic acid biosynthesis protein TuaB [Candidatus Brocadiaceae bacterium B188]|nr:MOP flippase family protein [Candidatus Brocadia sapporoensis]RZV59917.1 MAG: MOP flippase family protein [Candidatus Brocadia sp. BROELEC01]TWU49885.1 Teichuronic acid biosynthesis protein TuaB [Candidatus Brocadiaceae bacterium B188]